MTTANTSTPAVNRCMLSILDDIYLIYELCAYDKYLMNQTSFWCSLLTDEDRLVLEYGSDIEVRRHVFNQLCTVYNDAV